MSAPDSLILFTYYYIYIMDKEQHEEASQDETTSKINIPELARIMLEDDVQFAAEGRSALIAIVATEDEPGDGYDVCVRSVGDTNSLPPELAMSIALGVRLGSLLINNAIKTGRDALPLYLEKMMESEMCDLSQEEES